MQLLEKTKVYFSMPVFQDIGDEKELEEEKKLSDILEIAHMRTMGYYEGSIVVSHTCKEKQAIRNWGVITHIYEKYPELGNKFVPLEIKWFSGAGYGSNRYNYSDLFLIQEGPGAEVVEVLEEYNEDTTETYASN